MKTSLNIPGFIAFLFFFLLMPGFAPGQNLEQLISSRFELIDQKDHQILSCNSYRFEDKMLYENPNTLRLFENNAYRFDVSFAYFGEKNIITPENYLEAFYSIQIPPSLKNNYRITAISPKDKHLSVYAIATGSPGLQDTFRIQLLDKEAKLLGDVIYPFSIQSNDPTATTTSFMPIKIEYKPIYLTLEDADNPNNRIERQLLPFGPDTLNVNANDVFNLYTEIEQQVYLNDQAYILVANHQKNYGYSARFRWEGKALADKPGSEDGLQSYLTIVPTQDQKPNELLDLSAVISIVPTQDQKPNELLDLSAVISANFKQAGLNQVGTRVQQQYNFVAPNAKVEKVYSDQYLRANPMLSKSRKDQSGLQYLTQKNLPKVQAVFKTSNQESLQYYGVDQSSKLQLQKGKVQLYQQAPKVETPSPSTNSTEMFRTPVSVKALETTTKESPHQTQMATQTKTKMLEATPATTYQQVYIMPVETTKDPYYTLAIEIIRETDVLSYQTYFVTFRVID